MKPSPRGEPRLRRYLRQIVGSHGDRTRNSGTAPDAGRTPTPAPASALRHRRQVARRLVRAELATLAATFPEVALIAPPDGAGNHVLVASRVPIDLGSFAQSEGPAITGEELLEFVGQARVLRDDFAPADQLLTRS